MPDGIHSYQAAQTAADGSDGHQRGLRDAPSVFSRPVLVRKHKEESYGIDCKEVQKQIFHNDCSLSGGMNLKLTVIIALAVFLLAGCAPQETFETVTDDLIAPVSARVRETVVALPEEAASPTVESESGRIYLCDGYEITVQTFLAGDLDATVRSISGYSLDDLTVMQTESGDADRYEFVWACVGEGGDRIGRAVILDDGDHHYVLMVLGEAQSARENSDQWLQMFRSFRLV